MTRSTPKPKVSGLRAAVARGAAAKRRLIDSGEVVPASTLAAKWGVATQFVCAAARRGELSYIVILRRRYYPKEFLELDLDIARSVSKALSQLSPESALVFWKRPHGALCGATPAAVLRDASASNRLARVEELARAWAAQSLAG